MLTIQPDLVEQGELQVRSIKHSALIIHHNTINTDFTLPYELPAGVTRTKTLRLQDAIKAELCHPKNAPSL
jgi:hypothetical protein